MVCSYAALGRTAETDFTVGIVERVPPWCALVDSLDVPRQRPRRWIALV
jgi:hypothetical protein